MRFTSAFNLFFLFNAVFLVELINTSTSLSSFLLSCVEWMTLGADFYVDVLLCRSCYKCVSTVTSYSSLILIRMDTFAHDFHLSIFIYYLLMSLNSFLSVSQFFTICNTFLDKFLTDYLLCQFCICFCTCKHI